MPPAPIPTLPAGTPQPIAAFLSHWAALPKQGLLPKLSDYLDHAPAHLQPFVAMADVYSPTNLQLRLFGTGLVDLSGRDPTGSGLDVLYAKELQSRMGNVAWEAVSRPAGYLCSRSVRTSLGHVMTCPSIFLPLENHKGAPRIAMTYAHVSSTYREMAHREPADLVQGLVITHWIDLGAGVPDKLQ